MKAEKIFAGLTGGIASGKSAAAEMFRDAGAYIIDTDVIARRVSESREGKTALMSAFPAAYEGGTLHRARLREIVFADGQKRQLLDSLLHPLIRAETMRLMAASPAAVTMVVVPLLFEAGFDSLTSPNITVACNENTRIERLTKRDTISAALAKQMIAAQLSDEERAARADMVIDNNGTLAQLRAQVVRIYCELAEQVGR